MNKLKEVKVIWVDAKSYNGEWLDLERISEFEPEVCNTKGWVVYENKDILMVAQSISECGAYNIMLIPKGCIRRIEHDSTKN